MYQHLIKFPIFSSRSILRRCFWSATVKFASTTTPDSRLLRRKYDWRMRLSWMNY